MDEVVPTVVNGLSVPFIYTYEDVQVGLRLSSLMHWGCRGAMMTASTMAYASTLLEMGMAAAISESSDDGAILYALN